MSPFLSASAVNPHAMRENRALGLLDWRQAEFHAAALSARNGFLRSEATISPMIETAISAGLTAPMSSPIGAWMRASAASSKPLSAHALDPFGVRFSRSERADIETIRLERDHRARGRRSWDRGSKGRWRYSGRAAPRQSASSGHLATMGMSGKRSGVAKAVRGSMIETSRPAICAIGASACEICTAPMRVRRGDGA